MNLAIRFAAIVVSACGVVAGAGYLTNEHQTLAQLVVPTAVAAWVVFTIHHSYLINRQYRWRRRQHTEAQQLQQLAIPHDVAKPAAFPGVAVIDTAQHTALPTLPDYQATTYARGVTVAAMPSIAVLIAAVQATTTTPNTTLAIGLAIANVAIMTTLVGMVWRARNPSEPWVQARTRAELLRREQYLCLAAVGPYQNLEHHQISDVATRRTTAITTATGESLHRLITMRADDGHTHWHDQLWTQPNPPLDTLPQRARSYLHYRIRKQIMWFTLGHDLNNGAERRIATVIKTSLLAAVAATLLQTAIHLARTPQPAPLTTAASILTLVLPPICAFLLATQELYSHRRLAASYSHMIEQLVDDKITLTHLVRVLDNHQTDTELAAASRQFQAAVLHTENALTDELQRWRMITQRDEYELSL